VSGCIKKPLDAVAFRILSFNSNAVLQAFMQFETFLEANMQPAGHSLKPLKPPLFLEVTALQLVIHLQS